MNKKKIFGIIILFSLFIGFSLNFTVNKVRGEELPSGEEFMEGSDALYDLTLAYLLTNPDDAGPFLYELIQINKDRIDDLKYMLEILDNENRLSDEDITEVNEFINTGEDNLEKAEEIYIESVDDEILESEEYHKAELDNETIEEILYYIIQANEDLNVAEEVIVNEFEYWVNNLNDKINDIDSYISDIDKGMLELERENISFKSIEEKYENGESEYNNFKEYYPDYLIRLEGLEDKKDIVNIDNHLNNSEELLSDSYDEMKTTMKNNIIKNVTDNYKLNNFDKVLVGEESSIKKEGFVYNPFSFKISDINLTGIVFLDNSDITINEVDYTNYDVNVEKTKIDEMKNEYNFNDLTLYPNENKKFKSIYNGIIANCEKVNSEDWSQTDKIISDKPTIMKANTVITNKFYDYLDEVKNWNYTLSVNSDFLEYPTILNDIKIYHDGEKVGDEETNYLNFDIEEKNMDINFYGEDKIIKFDYIDYNFKKKNDNYIIDLYSTVKNNSELDYNNIIINTHLYKDNMLTDYKEIKILENSNNKISDYVENEELFLNINQIKSDSEKKIKMRVEIKENNLKFKLGQWRNNLLKFKGELSEEINNLNNQDYRIIMRNQLDIISGDLDVIHNLIVEGDPESAVIQLQQVDKYLREIQRQLYLLDGELSTIRRPWIVEEGRIDTNQTENIISIDSIVNDSDIPKYIEYDKRIMPQVKEKNLTVYVNDKETDFKLEDQILKTEVFVEGDSKAVIKIERNEKLSEKNSIVKDDLKNKSKYNNSISSPYHYYPKKDNYIIKNDPFISGRNLITLSQNSTKIPFDMISEIKGGYKFDNDTIIEYYGNSIENVSKKELIKYPTLKIRKFENEYDKEDPTFIVKKEFVNNSNYDWKDYKINLTRYLEMIDNINMKTKDGEELYVKEVNISKTDEDLIEEEGNENFIVEEFSQNEKLSINFKISANDKKLFNNPEFMSIILFFDELMDYNEYKESITNNSISTYFENRKDNVIEDNINYKNVKTMNDRIVENINEILNEYSHFYYKKKNIDYILNNNHLVNYDKDNNIYGFLLDIKEELNSDSSVQEESLQSIDKLEDEFNNLYDLKKEYNSLLNTEDYNKEEFNDLLSQLKEINKNIYTTYDEISDDLYPYIQKEKEEMINTSRIVRKLVDEPNVKNFVEDNILLELDYYSSRLIQKSSELDLHQSYSELPESLNTFNKMLKDYEKIKDLMTEFKEFINYKYEKVWNLTTALDTINSEVRKENKQVANKIESTVNEGESTLENIMIIDNDELLKVYDEISYVNNKLKYTIYNNEKVINDVIDGWSIDIDSINSKIQKLEGFISDTGGSISFEFNKELEKLESEINNIPSHDETIERIFWLENIIIKKDNILEEIKEKSFDHLSSIVEQIDDSEIEKIRETINEYYQFLKNGTPTEEIKEKLSKEIEYAKKYDPNFHNNIPITSDEINEYEDFVLKLNEKILKVYEDLSVIIEELEQEDKRLDTLIEGFEKYNEVMNNKEELVEDSPKINQIEEKYTDYSNLLLFRERNAERKITEESNHSDENYVQSLKNYYDLGKNSKNQEEYYKSITYYTTILGMDEDNYIPPSNIPPQATFEITYDKNRIIVDASDSKSFGNSTIESYQWKWKENKEFKEGKEKDNYIYENSGRYEITLKVIDNTGKESTTSKWVDIESNDISENRYNLSGIIYKYPKEVSPDEKLPVMTRVPVQLGKTHFDTTNLSGEFGLKNIIEGEYTLKVEFSEINDNYKNDNKKIMIDKDKHVFIYYDVVAKEMVVYDNKKDYDEIGLPRDEDNDEDDPTPPDENDEDNNYLLWIIGIIILIIIILIILYTQKEKIKGEDEKTQEENTPIFDENKEISENNSQESDLEIEIIENNEDEEELEI
ncbi:MAG: hypothetical protein ACOCP8_02080 [archaeon]